MSYRSHLYGADEISLFLRAVDRHLVSASSVVIIGGSAAAFYNATSTTTDVDTYAALSADLQGAVERAATETGLTIPVIHSLVVEVPWAFEDRLERQLPELEKLQVWVLEKHDLALSKTVRGTAHDEQQIREIHLSIGLEFDTLVQRFRDEMTHVTGDPTRIRSQFLQLIEALFGELKRVTAERTLDAATSTK
jgi:hypothetical protein